ncbi:hypothetical protein GJ496_004459 [Pomphorhynchus laevis]|nr:hypothetical protein GJ496_004459 [Pomphorhynchus laevis]
MNNIENNSHGLPDDTISVINKYIQVRPLFGKTYNLVKLPDQTNEVTFDGAWFAHKQLKKRQDSHYYTDMLNCLEYSIKFDNTRYFLIENDDNIIRFSGAIINECSMPTLTFSPNSPLYSGRFGKLNIDYSKVEINLMNKYKDVLNTNALTANRQCESINTNISLSFDNESTTSTFSSIMSL